MRPISRRTVIRVLRFRHDFFITSTLSTVTITLHCTCPRCCTPCCTFLAFATALRDKLLNRRWSMPWFSHRQVAQRLTAKKNVGTRRCLQNLSPSVFYDKLCPENRASRKDTGL